MPDLTFNTPAGQTIARELLICCLNTGTTEAPVWNAIGKRVESSDIEMDWDNETVRDILGGVWTTMKKPTKTQTFDPMPLDAGDPAAVKLWNLAIREEDAQALAAQDMLICHFFAGAENNNFAERQTGCSISITRYGGDGGGNVSFGTEVTYGGDRILGTAVKSATGEITFTPDTTTTA